MENLPKLCFKWDIQKLEQFYQRFTECSDKTESTVNLFKQLNILRCVLTSTVPSGLFDKDANSEEIMDTILCNMDVNSDLFNDPYILMSVANIVIDRCIVNKATLLLPLFCQLMDKLFSVNVKNNKEIADFLTKIWYTYLEHGANMPDNISELFARNMPFIIEKYVIEQVGLSIINGEFYEQMEFKRLTRLCCNSSTAFQIVTSILNEMLLLPRNGTLEFISTLMNEIKKICVADDRCIAGLYPRSLYALITILSLDVQIMKEATALDSAMLKETLDKEIKKIRCDNRLLAVLSHFADWITILDLPANLDESRYKLYRKLLKF